MKHPLVSVVIPAFNAAPFLRESIDSVLNQTFRDREIIVVDDGSTDATPKILKSYGDSIRKVQRSNGGRAAANNTGIQAARGEWIAFIDADDVWLPDKLKCQVELCEQYAISHTDAFIFGDCVPREMLGSHVTPKYAGDVLEPLLVCNFIAKSTVLIRKDLVESYGGFDESLDSTIDWPLWLRVCADHRLGYLAQPLTRYRLHSGCVSLNARQTLRSRLRVLDDAFHLGGVGHALKRLRNMAYAQAFATAVNSAGRSGDVDFALECALRMVAWAPWHGQSWKTLAKSMTLVAGFRY